MRTTENAARGRKTPFLPYLLKGLSQLNQRSPGSGGFWFLAWPEGVLNRRNSGAILRIENDRERRQGPKDAASGRSLTFAALVRLPQHSRGVELAVVPEPADEQHQQGGQVRQHGQEVG